METLELVSDAWPSGVPERVKSSVHQTITEQISQGNFNPDDIYYKKLTKPDLAEIKKLHEDT